MTQELLGLYRKLQAPQYILRRGCNILEAILLQGRIIRLLKYSSNLVALSRMRMFDSHHVKYIYNDILSTHNHATYKQYEIKIMLTKKLKEDNLGHAIG
jgi:hypothetical protein